MKKKSAGGRDKNFKELLVNGDPFIILGGELRNSSGATQEMMNKLCAKAREFGLNTLLVPIYWELLEPKEGKFDFSLVESHIKSAEKHGLKLVFLWFGTWKNATSCYVPDWVKKDLMRFPRLQTNKGLNANAVSCLSDEACRADSRAFANLMRRIKKVDSKNKTVLMMQIENETGVLGSARDRSYSAEKEFRKELPPELRGYLIENRKNLSGFSKKILETSNPYLSGTWSDVFSNDADEIFMAWHIAKYVNCVAEAGKKEYDLPFYANAWLIHQGREKPGQYPSGGPVPKVLDIWKAAAPCIDFYAPDIYKKDFCSTCEEYFLAGNPIFIPETNWDLYAASSVFYVAGHQRGLGFCPFAIDDILGTKHPLADSYRLLTQLMPIITEAQKKNAVRAFYQQKDDALWHLPINRFKALVKSAYGLDEQKIPAGGIIIDIGDSSFLAAGRNAFIEFSTPDSDISNIEFICAEEVEMHNGRISPIRRLNGDETFHGKTIILTDKLALYRVKLNTDSIPVHHQSDWEFLGG